MKKILSTGLVWLWVAVLVLLVDRVAKTWMLDHLILGEPVAILPIFNLTLAYNTGAAFNFLHNASGWQNLFLGSLAFIVSVVIIRFLYQYSARAVLVNIALCLILGGALGNAWDRILYSHVIDFFDFHINTWHFAIFNTADSAICIGAFLLIVNWIFEKK